MRQATLSFWLTLLLIALGYFVLQNPHPSRAQSGQSGAVDCCGPTHPTAPRELDFPYYSLQYGFGSTLNLVSDSPDPLDFTLSVHNRSGQTLVAPKMTIQPQAKLPIDMAALLKSLVADVTGDFSEGSVSLNFVGTIMPLVGQMTTTNPGLRLVHESEMVENDPGRTDIPAVLEGLWWNISGGRDAQVMVTNMSSFRASADVFLDYAGERHPSAVLNFRPHELKTVSIIQLLADLNATPSQVPEGGIMIIQRELQPSLIAQGKVLDPVTGFSATLSFPDPARERSNLLHASGVPIGTPTKDSPFARTGYFVPHVVVRNMAGTPQTVTITVEYPKGSAWNSAEGPGGKSIPAVRFTGVVPKGQKNPNDALGHPPSPDPAMLSGQLVLAPLTIEPYSTLDYSLDSIMGQLPLPIPYCSIRIQYSGAPGSAMAQVSSVEQKSDMVIDAAVANEGDGWRGSGANPWHLDKETESIVFLTDSSDKPARIGFSVTAGGVHYYLTTLKLAPHETRAIDIRKLRDAQQSDFKKNKIPFDATDGSVSWIRIDNVPVSGRLVVIERHKGIASSYDCCTCFCPTSYSNLSVSPSSWGFLPGDWYQCTAQAQYIGCNGALTYYDVTYSATWTSNDTSIATVNSGDVYAVAGGSTGVMAEYSDYNWYWNSYMNTCVSNFISPMASATANVCGLSITSPANGQVFDLGGASYNSASIPLAAQSACSGTANWTLNFSFTSSNGTPYSGSASTSASINPVGNYQTTNYPTPAGVGGQVTLTAQAQLAGSSFTQSETIYVDGTTIPSTSITSQLVSLYSGATPHLLTGICVTESSYKQFNTARSLYEVLNGLWPIESPTPAYGQYVGLMQVPNGMPTGFDWLTNTVNGENILQQKLSIVQSYVTTQRNSHPSLPDMAGTEYEDDALVRYGGYLASDYIWVPDASYSTWTTNPSSNAFNYVANIRNNLQ